MMKSMKSDNETCSDSMVLAEGIKVSMDTEKTGLNNNVLVVGGSGSGKTMSVVEPRLLTAYNTNMIVTVSKRRLITQYKPLLQKRGYTVYDLNLTQPKYSDIVYNPLDFVHSVGDVRNLAETIVESIANSKSNADPYWNESAKALLIAEIVYVRFLKRKTSFEDVIAFHESMAVTSHDDDKRELFDKQIQSVCSMNCEKKSIASHMVLSYWNVYNSLPPVTRGCIYGSLTTALKTVFSETVLKLMHSNKPRIDFRQLAEKKTVLFISTSIVNSSLSKFVNLFYADAFKNLFAIAEERIEGCLPIPVQIICDDFAVGGKIPKMPEYMSIIRELKISAMLLIQSESQLTDMYSHSEATGIINNCDTYVYLGGMDLDTAKNMSQKINKPMEDVLWMSPSKVVVCRRGQKPIMSHRTNVYAMKLYKEIKDNYDRLSEQATNVVMM